MEHISEEQLYKLVGSSLKARRLKLEITQEELANRVGMLRTSITNIEAGNQRPPLHVLYQFCQALGIEMQDILPLKELVLQEESEIVDLGGKQLKVSSKTADYLRKKLEE